MKDPQTSINRRQFLKLTTFGTAGLLPETSPVTTEPDREEYGHLPESSVFTDCPTLLPRSITNCTQKVPSEQPIQHQFAWKTVANENKDELVDVKEAAEYSFTIDDEYVHESDGEWKCEFVNANDEFPTTSSDSTKYWRLKWTYPTSRKSPGIHTFTTTIQFNRPHTSKISGNKTQTRSGTYQYRGRYEVVPLSSHREI